MIDFCVRKINCVLFHFHSFLPQYLIKHPSCAVNNKECRKKKCISASKNACFLISFLRGHLQNLQNQSRRTLPISVLCGELMLPLVAQSSNFQFYFQIFIPQDLMRLDQRNCLIPSITTIARNLSFSGESVTIIPRTILFPTNSVLSGDVSIFGWIVLVIQVPQTQNSVGQRRHQKRCLLNSFKCFKNVNRFSPDLNMF